MKRIYLYSALALTMLSFSGCTDDDNLVAEGEGCLALSTSFDSTVNAESRAISEDEQTRLNESLVMWLYRHTDDAATTGVIRQYKGIDQVPQSLMLNSGTYSVEAWAGDSVSASWDKRWYHGVSERVAVTKDATSQVNVVCKISNVAVEVLYDQAVLDALQVDKLAVSHTRGLLEFEGNAPEHTVGYFMMPNGETMLSWTLVGHRKEGEQAEGTVVTNEGSIQNVKKGYKYIFKVTLASDESNPLGGGFLDIKIKEEPLATEEANVIVKVAPAITRDGGVSLDEPLRCAPGQVGEPEFMIKACGELTSVVIVNDKIAEIAEIVGGKDVDLINMQPDVESALKDYIIYAYKYDEIADNPDKSTSTLGVRFQKAFTDKFDQEGNYAIKFAATDSYGKTTEQTAKIIISDCPIEISPVDPATAAPDELTVNKVVIKGKIVDMDKLPDNPEISVYYAEGEQTARAEWQKVTATISGNTYSVTLTGLTPGTAYSYYAEVAKKDGSMSHTDIAQVTTEAALQLPNCGFEDWIKPGKIWLLCADEGEMFWDSGNHGSSTMNKNVTEYDESLKHGGSRSVRMTSQFVGLGPVGKFAAGNAFVGKYLKTDGTDGVLGWGRPFTGRPTALKAWVKYKPVAVNYSGAKKKDPGEDLGHGITSGDPDQGIIYIALLDGTTDSEYPDYPQVVKTKTAQLFDKDGGNVIAYGEKILDETSGDDMIEITIPVDYRRTDIRPTYILLTCAASKGGDYFIGGDGSTMWLDDLELIYE